MDRFEYVESETTCFKKRVAQVGKPKADDLAEAEVVVLDIADDVRYQLEETATAAVKVLRRHNSSYQKFVQ
jgi:hypothetical protein